MDDITIIAIGSNAGKVIPDFYEQVQKASTWLTQKTMTLNEKKEQLDANSSRFKHKWEERYLDYPGKLVKQCKDLGVCHRSSRDTNRIVIERTHKRTSICKNINTLPVKV